MSTFNSISAFTCDKTTKLSKGLTAEVRSRSISCPDLCKLKQTVAAKQFQQMAAVASALNTTESSIISTSSKDPVGLSANQKDMSTHHKSPGSLKPAAGSDSDPKVRIEVDKSIQTDAFVVYPYEHLFPSVIPQWISSSYFTRHHDNEHFKKVDETTKGGEQGNATTLNPYDILDQFIKSACDKANHAKYSSSMPAEPNMLPIENETLLLKDEVSLLHNQVLFERHRRETLGLRNRRLLGKTKSSRILEEANTALKDQLQIREAEITTLRDQLEHVRKEKHEVEEERAANAKQRDKEIERLVLENGQLKQANLELKERVARQEKEMGDARSEINKLQAALFNSKSEIEELRRKDNARLRAEAELVNLRKEVLLLGEIQKRYRDKVARPRVEESEQQRLFRNAYENQIAQMESAVATAKSEMEAAKGKALGLEQLIAKKDQVIAEQKLLHNRIKEDYQAGMPEAEEAYNQVVAQNLQLEQRILELNDQLDRSGSSLRHRKGHHGTGHQRVTSSGSLSGQSNVSLMASPTSPGYGEGYGEVVGSMSGIFSVHGKGKGTWGSNGPSVTANVDMPPHRQHAVPAMEEKLSFMVGSPPSSDGGSIGSNHSEAIRRVLSESGGPINLDRASCTQRPRGNYRQSQGGNNVRSMECSESAATLTVQRSGDSNRSLQQASPEVVSDISSRDLTFRLGSDAGSREGGNVNSAGSSMNGHTHHEDTH